MLNLEFPVVTSNLKAGMGIFGTADPFDSTKVNNGARNPVGSLAFFPSPANNGGYYPSTNIAVLPTAGGYYSGLLAKYVLFRSTTNTAMVAGAAPVLYTDETLGIVTGTYAEGLLTASLGNGAAAGWLPLNTATTAYGLGTAVSATILNNGGVLATGVGGSYVWIILSGFIPSAYVTSATVGQAVYSSAAAAGWSVTGVAQTSVAESVIGNILSTPSGAGIADVMAITNKIF